MYFLGKRPFPRPQDDKRPVGIGSRKASFFARRSATTAASFPAQGFSSGKTRVARRPPLYVSHKDGAPICFAGIWDQWKSPEGEVVESCSILTTSSKKLIESLHERMPVILHPQEFSLWLDRTTTDPEQLKPLYRPYTAILWQCGHSRRLSTPRATILPIVSSRLFREDSFLDRYESLSCNLCDIFGRGRLIF